MKKVLKYLVIIMLFSITLSGCSKSDNNKDVLAKIKERDTLVVGVKYDTNLFGLKDPKSGDVSGFDVDIAKEIAKKIVGDKKKIKLVEVTSKTRIQMLNNGDIDLIIATMTITDERKKQVDFSDTYFNAGQSLLVKKGSFIKSVSDLNENTKVIAVKGSTSADNIKKKAPNAKVLEFENYSEAFIALQAGQGDALTTDNAILYGMQKQDDSFYVIDETFTDEPYGIAVKKGESKLLNEVNQAISDLKTSGVYKEIYEKWIGETWDEN